LWVRVRADSGVRMKLRVLMDIGLVGWNRGLADRVDVELAFDPASKLTSGLLLYSVSSSCVHFLILNFGHHHLSGCTFISTVSRPTLLHLPSSLSYLRPPSHHEHINNHT
jgi:hypothetical protein